MLKTVKVPKGLESQFEKAQKYVEEYFKNRKEDPTKGTIEISGERYVLVRAASLSVDFFETVRTMYKGKSAKKTSDIAAQILYEVAHSIGKADAKNFHSKAHLENAIDKLSTGPIHFAYSGWASVDILDESKPSSDENFYLIYDHPYSFESDAWLKESKSSDHPVCIMNAGYSSGWCEESFGVSLVASEIMCKAKGDDACRFIMAHPSRIEGYIQDYMGEKWKSAEDVEKYEMPGFFERKMLEDEKKSVTNELEKQNKFLKIIIESLTHPFYVINTSDYVVLIANSAAKKEQNTERVTCHKLVYNSDFPCSEESVCPLEDVKRQKKPMIVEHIHKDKDGNNRYIEVHAYPIFGDDGEVVQMIEYTIDITERKLAEEMLSKKIRDLEIFHKVAVGRELKMIELKKRVEELQVTLDSRNKK
jgi:predicted hydrocarbon binding protein